MDSSSNAAYRRRRRNTSEVSCCIKYVLFSFNVVFWLIGAGLIGIGAWAWSEKDTFSQLGKATDIVFDPVLFFILIGGIIFFFGFFACLGALRENTCLLNVFLAALTVLLLGEIAVGVLGFVYKGEIEAKVATFLEQGIEKYRDDTDLQNIIDWVQQTWLMCCGINSPDDWNENSYFNCTQNSLNREACGVPYSCCIVNEHESIMNRQCGYDVRKPENADTIDQKIYTTGCIDKGKQWLEANLYTVGGVALGIALLELLSITLTQCLISDIKAQKAKWKKY